MVVLLDVFGAGGAERLAVALAGALPRRRFEVAVCATRRSRRKELPKDLMPRHVPRWRLDRHGRFDIVPFRKLAAALRRNRVDVLHTHMFGSNVWGALIGRAAQVPVIVAHRHTGSFEGGRLQRITDSYVIGRLASAVVVGTRADRDRMVSVERVPSEKVVTIPGSHIPRPAEDAGDLKAELGLDPDTPLILTAARLRPEKALRILMEAFRHVVARVPGTHLVIAGDGPCRPELEAHASRLGISEQAHFLGDREDIETLLVGADVAAISSDYEGTSLFAVECMVHGTPLVSTAVGGPAEFLEDDVSAVLVPPRDPVALAGGLIALLRDPARRRSLARAAKAHSDRFQLDRIAARHAELYERLLAGLPPQRAHAADSP